MTTRETGLRGRDELLAAAIEHFAQHGVDNQSLRGLASAIGTSHRMLIYHFGSRQGVLTAVVQAVEEQQRQVLAAMLDDAGTSPSTPSTPSRELSLQFWAAVVDPALRYGPLFFELAAHAMQQQPHALSLRSSLVDPWLDPLTTLLERAGHPPARAALQARLGLAVARGLLLDLLVSGDRAAVDRAMELFVDLVQPVDVAAPDGEEGR